MTVRIQVHRMAVQHFHSLCFRVAISSISFILRQDFKKFHQNIKFGQSSRFHLPFLFFIVLCPSWTGIGPAYPDTKSGVFPFRQHDWTTLMMQVKEN